ncbi:MAG: hypothetical protein ACYTGC_11700 [Planctomycetota bacterium]
MGQLHYVKHVLIGGLVTVAVAWGCAWCSAVPRDSLDGRPTDRYERELPTQWIQLWMHRRPGYFPSEPQDVQVYPTGRGVREIVMNVLQLNPAVDNVITKVWATDPDDIDSDELIESLTSEDFVGETWHRMRIVEAGWPFRAFYGCEWQFVHAQVIDGEPRMTPANVASARQVGLNAGTAGPPQWPVDGAVRVRSLPQKAPELEARLLPFLPLWSGLAINLLFFGGISLLLGQVIGLGARASKPKSKTPKRVVEPI